MQIDRPITIAITLFIILVLIFFLVMPQYNNFKLLQQQLGEKTAEYNAQNDYYNNVENAYSELQHRQDDLKKIDDALPTDSNLGRLVYFLQQKGGENGVIIKSLFLSKSSAPAAGASVKSLGFSLNILGSYGSLGNFIRSIEKSSKIFEVTSISFNSGVGGATPSAVTTTGAQPQIQIQQIYSFNVEIKTYSY